MGLLADFGQSKGLTVAQIWVQRQILANIADFFTFKSKLASAFIPMFEPVLNLKRDQKLPNRDAFPQR